MKKKLLALLLAMAMAICLVFALPACNDAEDEENRNEQNENNNSGSDDGEDIAALVSQYIENSLAQEYITINFNGTADVESSDSYYGEEYTDSYNSTINAALMIAENDEYGVDMSISTVTDGTYSSDIFKDGVYYSSQNRESILETPLYTRRNDYYLGYQTRAEIAAYADMAVLAAELADNSDRLGISGITVSAENSDGGKLLTLEVNMGECLDSVKALIDKLDTIMTHEHAETINELFDDYITLTDFTAKLEETVKNYDLSTETVFSDGIMLLLAISNISSRLMYTNREFSEYFNSTFVMEWAEHPANAVFNLLNRFGDDTIKSLLAPPKPDDSVYSYIVRTLGSFRVTGLLDMIYDETGYGEEMFASFRQFALQENSVSLLEALEMVTDTEPGEIQRSLSAISIADGSTAKLELQSDSEGRIISVSTATNYDITIVDTWYDGTTYTDNEKLNVTMQFNLSYEQFTITAPSDEQIIDR